MSSERLTTLGTPPVFGTRRHALLLDGGYERRPHGGNLGRGGAVASVADDAILGVGVDVDDGRQVHVHPHRFQFPSEDITRHRRGSHSVGRFPVHRRRGWVCLDGGGGGGGERGRDT